MVTKVKSVFVPETIDCSDWSQVEPLASDLIRRTISNVKDLERWILDRSELEAALSECRAVRYISMTCHTDNAEYKQAFLHYVEAIEPKYKPLGAKMDRKFVECPFVKDLDRRRYEVLVRDTQREVELFREENVPIEMELEKLDQQYNEICGAMTCEFDGKTQTMPQMGRYMEFTDRAKREGAWRSMWDRRLADTARINDIYDEMISKRHQMAVNAGYDNYRDYQHDRMKRFDYKPSDCVKFHESVEKNVVPAMREIQRERAGLLKVDSLRPWDLNVDVQGREPLRPFEDVDRFIEGTEKVFEKMDKGLGKTFATLRAPGCLDLESRKGKAPGGYQYQRDWSQQPFIFMNAAGINQDVVTLLHEGGHAFHSMLCTQEPILNYRHAPIEFSEVASMSMELLAHPFMSEFYSADEAARAARQHLEGILTIIPWIATIDAFQHWVYTNPKHTREQRTDCWLKLIRRFGPAVDWIGIEKYRAISWQRQLHLFGVPFYYIEYGIAQLGALQIWMNYRKNAAQAVEAYKRGLSLGGSRPLPELWKAADIRMDFGPEMLASIVMEVKGVLADMPA